VYSNVRTAKIGKDSGESDLVGRPRDFAELPTKANYTYDDPFDMAGKKQFIESIYVDWFSRITPQTLELVEKKEFDKLQNSLDYLYVREVVSNALRLSILSTNKELGLNSQQYQALLQIPPTESNIDVFHETFQKAKKLWSNFKEKNWHNWNDMYLNEHAERISQIAGVIDEATYYAIIEMKEGGAGTTWRSNVIPLVKGIGPKTASFAWLLLSPLLSELATLDTWMLSYFYNDEKEEKPLDVSVLENYIVQSGPNKGQERLGYAEIENRVRSVRDALYPDEKLGVLQWGLWDYLRSKGWHQNHDALRVVVPVAYELIWWHGHRRSFKSQMINPEQIDQAKKILDENNDAKDIYCPYCGSKARVGQNPGEYICINREVGAENHVFTSDQQIFCPVRINNKVQCNNPAYSLGNNEYRCLPQKNNKEYTNPNYHVFTDKDFDS
jgi:hypothetical protein